MSAMHANEAFYECSRKNKTKKLLQIYPAQLLKNAVAEISLNHQGKSFA